METQKPSPEEPDSAKLNKNELQKPALPKECGGFADQNLLEPTRFGDWEVKGRCSDF